MRRLRLGRVLAPLALIVCAAAVFMVVRSTLGGEDGAAERRAPSGSAATATTSTTRTTPRRPRRRRYTVQAGDTLTAIAERTGVPVSRLRDLNPGTDPQSLRTGQRLRLAP